MNDLKIRMNFKQNKYYVSGSLLGTILYKPKTNLIFFGGNLCFCQLPAGLAFVIIQRFKKHSLNNCLR